VDVLLLTLFCFRYKLLLEQLHQTCSNAAAAAAAAAAGHDAASAASIDIAADAAAATADVFALVHEATTYINDKKREAEDLNQLRQV